MADKKWIQGAIKRPGSLRRKTHTKEGKNIPVSKLEHMAKMPGRTGRQARLALVLRRMHK